ncbi:hypothetical protein [Microvirga vignae]|uniref:hypothetical protein n=1 Tax=Microvirga vignae TaxID=1225564 RepID=UPI001237565B|nr:hypothetical protein [Microvirga vignae]
MNKSISKLRAALDGTRRDLDEIRDRIADLQAQRTAIQNAPVDRKTMEQRINYEINRVTAVKNLTFREISAVDGRFYASEFNKRFDKDPFALFAALDPEGLKAALLEHLPADGLTAEESQAKIIKLDAEILAAEMAEELTLREIEAGTGAAIPRRADADPRVLLAPDAELQA